MMAEETIVNRVAFREAMAHLSAAVNIVTTNGAIGQCGFTATAACSVSDDPPTLIVCMNRRSSQNETFKANGVLCVNTLAADQEALSGIFAGAGDMSMAHRFGCAEWVVGSTGAPLLKGALATFDCRIDSVLEVGTHSVLICRVESTSVSPTSKGLVYFKRRYHPVGAGAAELPQ